MTVNLGIRYLCQVNISKMYYDMIYMVFNSISSVDYQDYQDPSMKIPSWMAIGRGKKQTLINTPSRSSSDDQASS